MVAAAGGTHLAMSLQLLPPAHQQAPYALAAQAGTDQQDQFHSGRLLEHMVVEQAGDATQHIDGGL